MEVTEWRIVAVAAELKVFPQKYLCHCELSLASWFLT